MKLTKSNKTTIVILCIILLVAIATLIFEVAEVKMIY